MRENYERARDFVFQREGAVITDTPNDRGGLTAKYGLTLKTMKSLKLDLDHDGDVDAQDVYLVDFDVVDRVFREKYWDAVHADDLPGGVDLIMADIAWMSGPGKANQFRREGHKSANALTDRRKRFYESIIERDPSQGVFKNGWMNRASAALREAQKCEGAAS